MRAKTLTGAAFGAAMALASAAPAFAGTGSVNPTVITTDGQNVTVSWSGFANNVFVSQCSVSIADPFFTPSEHCETENALVGLPGAGGSAQFSVFKGPRPLLGFACGVTDDAVNNPVKPCFIRITDISPESTSNDIEFALTFPSDPVVPEVPYTILLPLAAAGALGAGLYLNRRRAAA